MTEEDFRSQLYELIAKAVKAKCPFHTIAWHLFISLIAVDDFKETKKNRVIH